MITGNIINIYMKNSQTVERDKYWIATKQTTKKERKVKEPETIKKGRSKER